MNTSPSVKSYTALTVVSPLIMEGEKKDQDRVRWFPEDLVGCVCDGVSSSPFSQDAAEFISGCAPVIFKGKIHDRFRVLADCLEVRRREARRMPISVPPNLPPGVAKMLQEAGRQKMQASHQTTMVAVALEPIENLVQTRFIRCGDSSFFVFSRSGELLASSLKFELENPHQKRTANSPGICFRPGTELMGRILGQAVRHPRARRLLRQQGLNPEKWVVCSVLAESTRTGRKPNGNRESAKPLEVRTGDRLLIPRYLVTPIDQPGCRSFGCFPFSRVIQSLGCPSVRNGVLNLSTKGHATAVVPDHVAGGDWTYWQKQFPLDSHFVLASDGFYSGFSSTKDLWAWLKENEASLAQESNRKPILHALHQRLQERQGDDDISFIWIRPSSLDPCV